MKKKPQTPSVNLNVPVLNNLTDHINHAVEKHHYFPEDRYDAIIILIEEIGEIAKAINDHREGKLSEKDAYLTIASESFDSMAVCARMSKKTAEDMLMSKNSYIYYDTQNEGDLRKLVIMAMFYAFQIQYNSNEYIIKCFLWLNRIIEVCKFQYSKVDK